MTPKDLCTYGACLVTTYLLLSTSWIMHENGDSYGPLFKTVNNKLTINRWSVEFNALVAILTLTIGWGIARQCHFLLCAQVVFTALVVPHVSTASFGQSFVYGLIAIAMSTIHNYLAIDNNTQRCFETLRQASKIKPTGRFFDYVRPVSGCCPFNEPFERDCTLEIQPADAIDKMYSDYLNHTIEPQIIGYGCSMVIDLDDKKKPEQPTVSTNVEQPTIDTNSQQPTPTVNSEVQQPEHEDVIIEAVSQ